MHRYPKKKILDPGIIIKSLSAGKFCRAQFVFILWSYCRLPRKVYQRVFPENGQSPVSRVSSERQGSPPNSHSGHRVRANTELKYLDAFPRNKQRAKKGYTMDIGSQRK